MRSLGYMPNEVELEVIIQRLDMDGECRPVCFLTPHLGEPGLGPEPLSLSPLGASHPPPRHSQPPPTLCQFAARSGLISSLENPGQRVTAPATPRGQRLHPSCSVFRENFKVQKSRKKDTLNISGLTTQNKKSFSLFDTWHFIKEKLPRTSNAQFPSLRPEQVAAWVGGCTRASFPVCVVGTVSGPVPDLGQKQSAEAVEGSEGNARVSCMLRAQLLHSTSTVSVGPHHSWWLQHHPSAWHMFGVPEIDSRFREGGDLLEVTVAQGGPGPCPVAY